MARNTARIGCVPMMFTSKVRHFSLPRFRNCRRFATGQRARHPAARNWSITRCTSSGDGAGVSACLYSRSIAFHLNAPELMERLHFDPLDVFHRRDEFCDPSTLSGSSVSSASRRAGQLTHRNPSQSAMTAPEASGPPSGFAFGRDRSRRYCARSRHPKTRKSLHTGKTAAAAPAAAETPIRGRNAADTGARRIWPA